MAERPIVAPSDRIQLPKRGAPGLFRLLAGAQVAMALGTLVDWAYGGFTDPAKLASGLGFVLMAPSSWAAAGRAKPRHLRALQVACVAGIALVTGSIVLRWL